MEHQEVVRARRMVRSYDPGRPVDDDVLARLLEQATRAPSAGHSQGRDLVVLRGAGRDRFWAVTTTTGPAGPDRWLQGMRTAPVLVLCLSDPARYVARYSEADKTDTSARARRTEEAGRAGANGAGEEAVGAGGRGSGADAWPIPYWDVDTGMTALLLLLGAVDAGLGACFFGVPDDRHDDVHQAFGIPRDRRLVGVVSLGHPAPDRRSPSLRRGRRPLAETVHEGRFGVPFLLAPTTATARAEDAGG